MSLLFFNVLHKVSSVWRAGFCPSTVRPVSVGMPDVQDAILLAETIPRRTAVPRAARAWEWGTIQMARGSRTDEEPLTPMNRGASDVPFQPRCGGEADSGDAGGLIPS